MNHQTVPASPAGVGPAGRSGPPPGPGLRLPSRDGRGPRVALLVHVGCGADSGTGGADSAARHSATQQGSLVLREAAVLEEAGATVQILEVGWSLPRLLDARDVLSWAPDVVHARGTSTLATALWIVGRCQARLVYEADQSAAGTCGPAGPGATGMCPGGPLARAPHVRAALGQRLEARAVARADAVVNRAGADAPPDPRELVRAYRAALMGPARARVGEDAAASVSGRRPRLLILSFSPIASDARVLKQVRLFSDTHEVTTCGYGEAPEGVVEHVRIPDELVYWRLDRASVIARRFSRAQRRQEVVAWARARLQVGYWDVVLADDVDTVPLALSLRPLGGVHADLHEYAPRQKEGVLRWRLFVAPYVRWLCRHYVTRADSVTTVAQGLADAYRREYGIRATVVTNATPYHELPVTPVGSPLRLVHSGAAMPERRLERMIEAVGLTRRDVTFDLYLARNDPALIERLRQQAQSLPAGRVRVLDPVPYTELIETLARYDVGVFCLPPVSFNYRYALPNKFFDFVQARLAIVVSPSPEMARLVHEHHLGAVTEDFTAASLARLLDSLTDEDVARAKQASAAVAHALSAERQTSGWAEVVAVLDRRAQALDPSIVVPQRADLLEPRVPGSEES